ncbi:hypothetical protein [Vibrio rotiferianus]|uniref:hypothetical protein n=1 Tax=Vibrio rotiferianus TaxID=190895 RepID=UPI0005F032F3|nr:hypothetical protein [Vibrio rotiferianus]
MHDDDYKKFCTSLTEMVTQVQSNLPHAKKQGFGAIGIDVSLDVAQELVKKLERVDKLDAENDRLSNALEYIYESGSLLNKDVVDKARWGLGIEVDNPEEIAALKPRYS